MAVGLDNKISTKFQWAFKKFGAKRMQIGQRLGSISESCALTCIKFLQQDQDIGHHVRSTAAADLWQARGHQAPISDS